MTFEWVSSDGAGLCMINQITAHYEDEQTETVMLRGYFGDYTTVVFYSTEEGFTLYGIPESAIVDSSNVRMEESEVLVNLNFGEFGDREPVKLDDLIGMSVIGFFEYLARLKGETHVEEA